MYVCYCGQVTEEDLERDPRAAKLVGLGCGRCLVDLQRSCPRSDQSNDTTDSEDDLSELDCE